jgi:hypothetical protein
MPNGKLGGDKGTWTFDGDHTITLTFAVDGNPDEYQFYKAGDVMTLFVLTGFDEDENGGEKALVMTGTDNNHVTQFAKKISQCAASLERAITYTTDEISIEKSVYGNPIVGTENDSLTYGGDPSILVDGDTVYLFAGHDTATTEDYIIPEYLCYSSKDLVNWEYKGVPFVVNKTNVPWASGNTSAWASQVLKHNGKYYLYYCTWGNSTYSGYQCIGVAVADKPEGPYTNASTTPLINGLTMTTENTSGWNDIDPTGWIETDENGVEHIYLNWGNSVNYTCELNDDMVSVKDQNGDGKITSADIVTTTINNLDGTYTEAPYLYRRTDANGKYTGKYYLFFAKDWREQWAYATTDDIMSGSWDYGNLMMSAPATSNTSHGAVFDFNGKTYFVYHNGSLPGGSGFRRVANIQEVTFNDDGSIDTMEELSTGISGTATTITTYDGKYVGHDAFTNPLVDTSYPLTKTVTVGEENGTNTEWEIVAGKTNSVDSTYVSIQSHNKPGLYIKAEGTSVVLTQDDTNTMSDAMTFITRKALNGSDTMVSFESVSKPGYYLTYVGSKLSLSTGSSADNCSFTVGDVVIGTPAPTPEATPEPTPAANMEFDFEEQVPGTILEFKTSDQDAYTEIDGVTIGIGSRSSGGDSTTKVYIAAGEGVDGSQALAIANGKFSNADSRGPRIQFTTPVIPDGATAELTMQVRLDSGNELNVSNDFTTQKDDVNVNATADGTTWNTVKVTIERTGSVYKRTLYTNGEQQFTDSVSEFPVFWGINAQNTPALNLYIDNVSIETITAGSTPEVTPKPTENPDSEKANLKVEYDYEHSTKTQKLVNLYSTNIDSFSAVELKFNLPSELVSNIKTLSVLNCGTSTAKAQKVTGESNRINVAIMNADAVECNNGMFATVKIELNEDISSDWILELESAEISDIDKLYQYEDGTLTYESSTIQPIPPAEINGVTTADNSVTFTIKNLNGETVDAYVASYGDGRLTGISKTEVNVDSNTKTLTVEGNFGGNVKVMVWNGLEALADSVTVQ